MVDPAHFAPLFGRKPRAQVMLYREALLELGPLAAGYVGELSRRQRARLGAEILGLYALYERHGAGELLAAMALATAQGAYGVGYLQALLAPPDPAHEGMTPPIPAADLRPSLLALADLPPQVEVDRALSTYESYVWIPDRADGGEAALATVGEVLP
jgi:hypothetical protein